MKRATKARSSSWPNRTTQRCGRWRTTNCAISRLAAKSLERELRALLVPKDPNDEKNVIVEIRAGTGGDEASLFAGELFRMYSRYAESQGWRVEILESSPSSVGGLKEVVAAIQGQQGLLEAEIRERRASRAARARDRAAGPHPYIRGDRRGAARSGRNRHQDRGEGSAHRYVLLVGPRRAIGEHDVLRRSHHAYPERARRVAAGRKIPDQESREGHARVARAPV